MAGRGYNVRLVHTMPDGTPFNIACKLIAVKSESIRPKPKIIKKDSEGNKIKGNKKTSVLKDSLRKFTQTGNPSDIEPAAGRTTPVYLNDNGMPVKEHEITTWYEDPSTGQEIEVEPHDPTIGSGHTIEIKATRDISEKDDYIIEKTYTLVCDPSSAPMLFKIAEDLENNNTMGIIDVVTSQSFDKAYGMIIPTIDRTAGKFNITVYVTRAKIEPGWMDIQATPTKTPTKRKPGKPGKKKIQQNDIFSAPRKPRFIAPGWLKYEVISDPCPICGKKSKCTCVRD